VRVAAPPILKEVGGIHPSILPLGPWLGQVPILAACDTREVVRRRLLTASYFDLDDLAFFAPFASYFHPVIGRPCTPVECYLRLMFLKFRYRLGFESLCAEVG
jgi:hypothetical protein